MKVIIFNIHEKYFAIESNDVTEIFEPAEITPVPFVPEFVDGIINVYGRIVCQIDLSLRLSLGDKISPNTGELLIVNTKAAEYALHASKVIQMTNVDDELIHDIKQTNEEIGDDEANDNEADNDNYSVKEEWDIDDKFIKAEFEWNKNQVLLLDISTIGLNIDVNLYNRISGGIIAVEKEIKNQAADQDYITCLVLEVNKELYAFNLTEVSEIVEQQEITVLPKTPPEIKGITSVRGTPLLSLSLAGILKMQVKDFYKSMVIIEKNMIRYGILVDDVLGIQKFLKDQLHKIDEKTNELEGCINDKNNKLVSLIRIDGLLSKKRIKMLKAYLPEQKNEAEANLRKSMQFLSFLVGNEQCALPLNFVEKVLSFKKHDDVPNLTGTRISGVIEDGGNIHPVIDLRNQFGFSFENTPFTSYIISEINGEMWALLVDKLNRIVNIYEDDIEPASNSKIDFVQNVGQQNGSLISIISLDPLNDENTKAVLNEMHNNSPVVANG